MKRAGLIDLLFFLCYPSTIGGEISLSDLFILFIFGRFRPQFHKNCKKVKKKKRGKVWIKISGDFATFLKFRSWKRSNIKSKHVTSGQIRSNTSKHIPKGEKQLNTKIWKRMMAGLLAGVLIFIRNPVFCLCGEPPVQMIIRGDAFQNQADQHFRSQSPVDHLLLCKSGGRTCTGILPAAGKETSQSHPGILGEVQCVTGNLRTGHRKF